MHQWITYLTACCIVMGFSCAPLIYAQENAASTTPVSHTYREVDGTTLQLYVFTPAGTTQNKHTPAVLLFHGGGWTVGTPEWTFASARRYADMGLVAISVQYRLSDANITPIDALDDVCAAFQWVRSQAAALGVDPERIAASGVSAGGHLAAAAATMGCGNDDGRYGNGGPDALLLWSPALDVSGDRHFRRLLHGRDSVITYSPAEHVHENMPPVHIVHGELDSLTPLSGAQKFCERVTAGGGHCSLVVYPGVGHLLTRNLGNQESNFDPDPANRDDGIARELAFVKSLWLR